MNTLFYGNFGKENRVVASGQTSKTINFYNEFLKEFGTKGVFKFNTYNFKKNLIRNILSLIKAIKKSDVIVIFPGGLANLKLLTKLLKFNKNIAVFYPVVGGWLASEIKNKKSIIKALSKFNCIYPETNGLKNELNMLGLYNVKVSPVFTNRIRIPFEDIMTSYLDNKEENVLKFVYFGRISEKKGVYRAAEAITKINNQNLGITCALDFFGRFQEEENLERFKSLLDRNIRYLGVLPDDKISCLGDYDFFVFPTSYEGEGFPATCVESLSYGTPILASDWAYNKEIVENNFNGFIFSLETDKLYQLIVDIIDSKTDIIELKQNAYTSSLKYLPNIAIKPFMDDVREIFESNGVRKG